MPDGIPEEDAERQVQDSDSIYGDEPQGSSMRYIIGELVTPKRSDFETAVWTDDMNDSRDSVKKGEVITVLHSEDDYGWVRVMTRRGITGIIHRTNLARLPLVSK